MKRLNKYFVVVLLILCQTNISFGQMKLKKIQVLEQRKTLNASKEISSLSLSIYQIGDIYYKEYSGGIEEYDMALQANNKLDTISCSFILKNKVVMINEVFLNAHYKINWVLDKWAFEINYLSNKYIGVFIRFISGSSSNEDKNLLIINANTGVISLCT